MDRLVAPNSVPFSGADLVPSTGTAQYATEGVPGTTPATQISAAQYNAMQDEMMNVILAAGITPDRANWAQLLAAIQSLSGAGTRGYKNLVGVWASNTTATFTADKLRLANSSNGGVLLNAFSETLNTAASGAGGLDTGAVADNTWYNVFAIYNPTTSTTNIMMSLSATAPTLPSGYTNFLRIGTVLTDSSGHLVGFKQVGTTTQYVVGDNLTGLPLMSSGIAGDYTIPTWVSVAVAPFCPPTATKIKLAVVGNYNNAGAGYVYAVPNNSYGNELSTGTAVIGIDAITTRGGRCLSDVILESSNVYWASSAAGGALICMGYQDHL